MSGAFGEVTRSMIQRRELEREYLDPNPIDNERQEFLTDTAGYGRETNARKSRPYY
jgi:hypothetical protein